MTEGHIETTFGAIALGGLVCLFLSGTVTMQVYLYLSVYKKDRPYIKSIVCIDFAHTIMVCIANWTYLISNFGDANATDHITCFFTHKIYVVSKGNYLLTSSLGTVALFRVGCSILVAALGVIRLQSYAAFVKDYGYVFTMGLGSAVAIDLFITLGLCYYLRQSKTGFANMNDVLDSLVLYTVETGLATCVTTIISLVCWVTMTHNLIFLGLHFTISKLYANSLMATLNSRAQLRARSHSTSSTDGHELSLPVVTRNARSAARGSVRIDPPSTRTVEINVQTTVHREVDSKQATEVDLKVYGKRSGPEKGIDDRSSSDMQSDRDKEFLGSM
ncbi:uncharacterized protein PHACADRAFT_167057 [Phanerochaete carnosa HHB-10118-sp]|uniref:DUF6534 domain-containing protein n=1 Tax=Phanerochaete carnosa (strain HHB-10118-sp) TaxID=650164 RepID=K5WHJ6_PHACS|nr:uncharacterized protein PHACADRAFT_167057 [Phanerochaete carnosa HHB-10118-sp]EKM49702.1 hypothetical protein PHACADRAFT_167057 [Phanerochaete carnosa HHB-10118-sp]